MQTLDWLMKWFSSYCDGDWEHENQIQIFTIDNPGWTIKIDLRGTTLENLELNYILYDNSESDWYSLSVKNSIFDGSGDLTKLTILMDEFKKLVIENHIQ